MRIIKMEKNNYCKLYTSFWSYVTYLPNSVIFFSRAPQDNDSLSLFAGWLALMMEVCPRLCEQTTKVIWDSSWDLLYNSPCLLYTCFSTLRVKWWMLLVTNKKKTMGFLYKCEAHSSSLIESDADMTVQSLFHFAVTSLQWLTVFNPHYLIYYLQPCGRVL